MYGIQTIKKNALFLLLFVSQIKGEKQGQKNAIGAGKHLDTSMEKKQLREKYSVCYLCPPLLSARALSRLSSSVRARGARSISALPDCPSAWLPGSLLQQQTVPPLFPPLSYLSDRREEA